MSKPINTENLKWQEWRHTDEIRLRFKILHDEPKAHMGVCIQELPRGCSTNPAHYHLKEEEHLFVLSGKMKLRLGEDEFDLSSGDYKCFSAGFPEAHCLMNPFNDPCEYLLWGERDPNDVVVYPDSNKVSVRALGEIYRRLPLDYWDGEE